MPVPTYHTRPADNAVRLSGALIGIGVFAVGIFLLWWVFQDARSLFSAPAPRLNLSVPQPTPTVVASPTVKPQPAASPIPATSPTPVATPDVTTKAVSEISGNLLGFVRQWLLLLLMCIAGSFIASRGIELFFRACATMVVHPPKDVLPPSTP